MSHLSQPDNDHLLSAAIDTIRLRDRGSCGHFLCEGGQRYRRGYCGL